MSYGVGLRCCSDLTLLWLQHRLAIQLLACELPYATGGTKKEKKKTVYMCMTESLCCTAEINTTLYINYTSIKNLKRTLFLDVHLTTMKVNFCVHLNGMWSGQILCYTLFLLVSVRVFLVRLTFELID